MDLIFGECVSFRISNISTSTHCIWTRMHTNTIHTASNLHQIVTLTSLILTNRGSKVVFCNNVPVLYFLLSLDVHNILFCLFCMSFFCPLLYLSCDVFYVIVSFSAVTINRLVVNY